ncbi:hypothetical protein NA57DRAFT_82086 [Rhizodiscina lignyota]|uniref:Uncharacterized protein n=1 Tax=Rhizodiscina lignyota TaxID=1504668 RepID=A0A9P4I3X0_9PEZI|nr:hypothetical protein NA57DRAFT_82086 [Rhizodiscina lignyota]
MLRYNGGPHDPLVNRMEFASTRQFRFALKEMLKHHPSLDGFILPVNLPDVQSSSGHSLNATPYPSAFSRRVQPLRPAILSNSTVASTTSSRRKANITTSNTSSQEVIDLTKDSPVRRRNNRRTEILCQPGSPSNPSDAEMPTSSTSPGHQKIAGVSTVAKSFTTINQETTVASRRADKCKRKATTAEDIPPDAKDLAPESPSVKKRKSPGKKFRTAMDVKRQRNIDLPPENRVRGNRSVKDFRKISV